MTTKPKIVTSSWFTPLPDEYAPIGISRGVPRGRSGYRTYRRLAPGAWFNSTSTEEFTRRYREEILDVLDAERVVENLLELADGKTPALLCWERPEQAGKWCHRALVSVWLCEKLGLQVPEYGQEEQGFGWDHPKLHPETRRPKAPGQTRRALLGGAIASALGAAAPTTSEARPHPHGGDEIVRTMRTVRTLIRDYMIALDAWANIPAGTRAYKTADALLSDAHARIERLADQIWALPPRGWSDVTARGELAAFFSDLRAGCSGCPNLHQRALARRTHRRSPQSRAGARR